MNKVLRRRHAVLGVLARGAATGWAVQAALVVRGVRVSQATVSRDLRALGAVRSPLGWTVPRERARKLRAAFRALSTL